VDEREVLEEPEVGQQSAAGARRDPSGCPFPALLRGKPRRHPVAAEAPPDVVRRRVGERRADDQEDQEVAAALVRQQPEPQRVGERQSDEQHRKERAHRCVQHRAGIDPPRHRCDERSDRDGEERKRRMERFAGLEERPCDRETSEDAEDLEGPGTAKLEQAVALPGGDCRPDGDQQEKRPRRGQLDDSPKDGHEHGRGENAPHDRAFQLEGVKLA
jgi:hypothetical protein